MMSRSHVVDVTILSMAIVALKLIISHELTSLTAHNDVWNDPAWKNLSNTLSDFHAFRAPTTLTNTTTANASVPSSVGNDSAPVPLTVPPPFYTGTLPFTVLFTLFVVPFNYYWHSSLERCLPARREPRRSRANKPSPAGKTPPEKLNVFDEDGNREEEVVKRWIEDGRVKRPSISVCNTLAKWLLNYTVGAALRFTILNIFEATIKRQSLNVLMWRLPMQLTRHIFSFATSIVPLASLVSFFIVPVQHRVVFNKVISLAETVFIKVLMQLVLPWAMRTEFAQEIMIAAREGLEIGMNGDLDALENLDVKHRLKQEL